MCFLLLPLGLRSCLKHHNIIWTNKGCKEKATGCHEWLSSPPVTCNHPQWPPAASCRYARRSGWRSASSPGFGPSGSYPEGWWPLLAGSSGSRRSHCLRAGTIGRWHKTTPLATQRNGCNVINLLPLHDTVTEGHKDGVLWFYCWAFHRMSLDWVCSWCESGALQNCCVESTFFFWCSISILVSFR